MLGRGLSIIYLEHNATTSIDEDLAEEMENIFTIILVILKVVILASVFQIL
ncbi:MAG: hypothetical protein R6V14_00425 [Halanaerobiales bacterium]